MRKVKLTNFKTGAVIEFDCIAWTIDKSCFVFTIENEGKRLKEKAVPIYEFIVDID